MFHTEVNIETSDSEMIKCSFKGGVDSHGTKLHAPSVAHKLLIWLLINIIHYVMFVVYSCQVK